MFGISSAQASAAGLTISSGLAGIFWVYFVFVISLLVSCAWLFTEPGHPVMSGIHTPPWSPAGGDQGTRGAAGAPASEDGDSDVSEDTDSDDVDSEAGSEGGEQSILATSGYTPVCAPSLAGRIHGPALWTAVPPARVCCRRFKVHCCSDGPVREVRPSLVVVATRPLGAA